MEALNEIHFEVVRWRGGQERGSGEGGKYCSGDAQYGVLGCRVRQRARERHARINRCTVDD